MQGVALGVRGHRSLGVIDRCDQILRRVEPGPRRRLKLGIYWAEITSRSHQNVMGSHCEKGSSALCLVRHDHGKRRAASLSRAGKADRGLAVTARSIKKQMQLLIWICIGN